MPSDYQRVLEAERIASAIPPELRRLIRLAAWGLFVAPALLWIAWKFLGAATPDVVVEDNGEVLIAWGSGVIGLAAWQITSRSVRLIPLRKAVLWGALIATLGLAGAYVYGGLDAYGRAAVSTAERTYELRKSCGRRCVSIVHQRADGTTIEGTDVGPLADYARGCALVQRLDGDHGFSWVRVLERSRAPGRGQLAWPIRREECFSDTPLSSLPR